MTMFLFFAEYVFFGFFCYFAKKALMRFAENRVTGLADSLA